MHVYLTGPLHSVGYLPHKTKGSITLAKCIWWPYLDFIYMLCTQSMNQDNPRIVLCKPQIRALCQTILGLARYSPTHYFLYGMCMLIEPWHVVRLLSSKRKASIESVEVWVGYLAICFVQCFGCNPRIPWCGQSKNWSFIHTLHPSFDAIQGLCGQSENCCAKLGSKVCTGQYSNCPNSHFAHTIYIVLRWPYLQCTLLLLTLTALNHFHIKYLLVQPLQKSLVSCHVMSLPNHASTLHLKCLFKTCFEVDLVRSYAKNMVDKSEQ